MSFPCTMTKDGERKGNGAGWIGFGHAELGMDTADADVGGGAVAGATTCPVPTGLSASDARQNSIPRLIKATVAARRPEPRCRAALWLRECDRFGWRLSSNIC